MLLPDMKKPQAGGRELQQFYGYNAMPSAQEGEFAWTENLWGGDYPLLSTRPQRGTLTKLANPQGLIAKDALLWVDDGTVYYNGYAVSGLTLTKDGVKQIASMGAYAVFFPDKKYLNTADLSDCGSLDAVWEAGAETEISYTICTADGESYGTPAVQATAPAEPENGALWIDTSEETHVLRRYSESSREWISIPTVYVRIEAAGIGAAFAEKDGVEIRGCSAGSGMIAQQIEALNATKLIYARGNDYIVVVGLLDQAASQTGGVRIAREAPDMDYICECGNRLWGCKYGLVDGKPINEIYCCKLGDFKNWRSYEGIATDAWAASRGADGQFTGAITYQGHPIFFRERSIEVVYPSAGGAHQIVTNECAGVQRGSWRSLAIAGDTLYYKSPEGVCAYTGSMPVSVSAALGGRAYRDARAGAAESRYYISMQDTEGAWHLFCYDAQRRFWHREDATEAVMLADADGDLYYLDGQSGALRCCFGTAGTREGEFDWTADSALIGMSEYQKKYVSRISIRGQIAAGGEMALYMMYDSSGEWEYKCSMMSDRLRSFLLPVTPRRCDHVRLRLCGRGQAKIFGLRMTYEKGSDV